MRAAVFRWPACLPVLPVLLLAVACSKSAGRESVALPTNDKACGAAQAGSRPKSLMATSLDPFELYGKVLLEEKVATPSKDSYSLLTAPAEKDPAHASFLRSRATEAVRALAEATDVSVTLDLQCAKINQTQFVYDVLTQNGESLAEVQGAGVRSYTWRLPERMTIAQIRELAEGDVCVVGVGDSNLAFLSAPELNPNVRTEPNPNVRTELNPNVRTELNDPLFANQGHLKMLEATSVLDHLSTMNLGRPVVIAVIDSGIDLNHEDLKQVLWTNGGEVAANGIDDDGNGYVDDVNGYNFALKIPSPAYTTSTSGYQHGTHVSGLAAAQGGNAVGGTGVMGSGARIMMLNVFGAGSGAYTSNITNAIRYAADNGADVINLSLGGEGRSATYESAIAYAIRKGVVVVAAAGNDHREVGGDYWMSPGAYAKQFEGMLSIGSVDSSSGIFSYFSNYSPDYVELAAPGAEDARNRLGLLSTWPGGKYSRIQGTSMASPVVAGAAGVAIAMMRARGYAPSPGTIEDILELSAKKDVNLRAQVRGGRVLNIRTLKEFIETNYAFRSGSAIDPGVPGYVPCGSADGN